MSKKTLKKSSQPKAKASGIPLSYVIGGLLVVLIAISIFAFSQQSPPTNTIGADLSLGGQTAGKPDSKVTFVEFSDFQCPACGVAYPAAKQIQDRYSDRVRFVYQHFPLTQLHPLAVTSAEAAECAGQQGKFWQAHDLLFENQSFWTTQESPTYGPSGIRELFKDLNLDLQKFEDCWTNRKGLPAVQAGLDLGNKIGVAATPAFYINGQKIDGDYSFEHFKTEIENRLK
ncbi:MAG: thioredoxin domain-containing protein [Candidatus Micrarchaeota archaeon]